MPSAVMHERIVPQVADFEGILNEAVNHAQNVKPNSSIEPPLNKADFGQLLSNIPSASPGTPEKSRQYAVVETAARDLFSNIVATTPIDSPSFVRIWNLFDILSILSDSEQCDPALLFWLVEELLDSQTIEGCRRVFDYLESRRERIKAKHFKQKHLVILRFSNELMRRLSRAKDTAFCGRLYIFMSLTFPLHDRSSVNLRGEYHVENETTYEDIVPKDAGTGDAMDIDQAAEEERRADKQKDSTKAATKAVSFDAKEKPHAEEPLDTDALYPIFWSLQHYFSQPLALFDPAHFTKFKDGMQATTAAFETVDKLQKTTKNLDESKIVPQKRKSAESAEERDGSNYNPKYLTSRDLFELEISDLYFRRHILIQALIIIEFLLSLTPQAKAKLSTIKTQNKSVVYADHVLSEDDTKWAQSMKDKITTYLQNGPDGYFFFRVVDSVLSRDKGWARWKVENCPAIEQPAVPGPEYGDAMESARRLATNKRLRPTPMGSLSLNFMRDEKDGGALEKLKDATRWQLPELESFKDKIATDDLELDFAKTEKEKSEIVESKASKTWRALRIARKDKLAVFDKIDDWQSVDTVFQDHPDIDDDTVQEDEGERGEQPQDSRPIILCGPPGVGKAALVAMLMERQKSIFGNVVQHTTRAPKDWEQSGKHYHFVDLKAFNTIVDGDYFLEFGTRDGAEYGTNRRLADALVDDGKVPLIRLDHEGTQLSRDNAYSARIICILPPSCEELESRLRKQDVWSEQMIQEILKTAQEEVESASSEAMYDAVITNGDLEEAYKELEAVVYGRQSLPTEEANGINGHDETQVNTEMTANGEEVQGPSAEAEEDMAMSEAPQVDGPTDEQSSAAPVEASDTAEAPAAQSS